MGPTKVKSGSSKGNNKRSTKPSASGSSSGIKKKSSSKNAVKPKTVQQKTKSTSLSNKPKKRVYTDKELGIPELNGIRPAGITKAPNAKKGKNFVDDKEGMNAILAMVMAEKEGNIESKMMRARQLEEVREARKAEMEKRATSKKAGLEERKQGIKQDGRRKRHAVSEGGAFEGFGDDDGAASKKAKPKKRVSFG